MEPEVFKHAEVVAFQALMTITAVSVVFQVVCGSLIDAIFDVVDRWCKKMDQRRQNKEKL